MCALIIRVSNDLDPDQDLHSVSPDLGQDFAKKGYQQKIKVTANKERLKLD